MKQKTEKKPKNKQLSFLDKINISTTDVDLLLENLALLLESGMDISSALSSVGREVRSGGMKKVLELIKNDIESGYSISSSLERRKIFPEHVISLLRVGEQSGRLSENLKVVVEERQKNREFKSKIRSAMIYPVLVLSLVVIVGLGVAWFVLPRLATVFSSLDLKLPLITKIMIAVGNFFNAHGIIAVPSFLAILFLIIFFTFFYQKTKFMGQAVLISLPAIKRLIQEVELSRFGYLLGGLLSAGLPIVDSIQSLASATTFHRYKNYYKELGESVEQGMSFEQIFDQNNKSDKVIPPHVQQMMIAAEESGRLPETLQKISKIYESKTENTTKNLAVILEPILLLIVWVAVLGVAVAVILPIYSLIGGLSSGVDTSQNNNLDTQETVIPISEPVADDIQELLILPTGVGYLNVREEPTTNSDLAGRVNPGEVYEYVDSDEGWYEIVISEDESGWVFGDFVQLLSDDE